jgi:hypothetical protein
MGDKNHCVLGMDTLAFEKNLFLEKRIKEWK